MIVRVELSMMSCCSVVFDILVGVFSVMGSSESGSFV